MSGDQREPRSPGLEQARAQRKRAERDYAEAVAQRPAVRAVARKAVRLREVNGIAQLTMLAIHPHPTEGP